MPPFSQAALESMGRIGEAEAIALATTNLDQALGIPTDLYDAIVVYEQGDVFNFESKPRVVLSPRRGIVDLL